MPDAAIQNALLTLTWIGILATVGGLGVAATLLVASPEPARDLKRLAVFMGTVVLVMMFIGATGG